MRPTVITVHLAIVLMLLISGCVAARPSSSTLGRSPAAGPVVPGDRAPGAKAGSREQLQSRLMAYSDRYLNRLSEAVDQIEALHTTTQCLIAAHATKYYPSLTVLALASEAEPESALLDLLVVVTLERMVWEGARSQEVFGEQAHILTTAQREVEADIWNVASSMLSPAQLDEMHELIEQWRRENPDRQYVSSMRFDDLAGLRAQRPQTDLDHGFLAPVSEAAYNIEQTRLLGERALFLSTRLPLVLHWQLELFTNELAGKPEVQAMISRSRDLTAAVERFVDVTQELPNKLAEQRAAFMHDIDSQEGNVREMLDDVRAGLDEATKLVSEIQKLAEQSTPLMDSAKQLVHSADATLVSADRLAARVESWQATSEPSTQPARPFDIRDYTEAATQMNAALKELNQTLSTPDRGSLLKELDIIINQRVAQSGAEARESIRLMFWRGAFLIGVGFACAVFVVWIRHIIIRRHQAHLAVRLPTATKVE